jgi:hypothetical protein
MARSKKKRHPVHALGLITSIGALTVMMSLTTATELWDTAKIMTASASVGTYAHVPANEHNVLAQQLAEKERSLNDREALLAQQERDRWSFGSTDSLAFSGVVLSLALLVLVSLNFYFDFHRGLPKSLAVDLRKV